MTMTAAPAFADDSKWGHGKPPPITVIATGLDDPFQVAKGYGGSLLVAENYSGEITGVNLHTGRTRVLVKDVPGATGATLVGGRIVITTGEGSDDATAKAAASPAAMFAATTTVTGTPTAAATHWFASVLTATPGRQPKQLADLLDYELKNNPDGQLQYDPTGAPLDTLSNPYSVIADRSPNGYALVADAGGNDVLKVDRHGKVTTFFVPPLMNEGACDGNPNNDPAHIGCDPVPTGLASGPGNTLYVTAVNGANFNSGWVYAIDARTAAIKRVFKGFYLPTGVAADNHGNVYVADVGEGAQDGLPKDVSIVGEITKFGCDGKVSHAQVTMPNGLLFSGGKLYATAWSLVAGLFGQPHQGQLVHIDDSAFVPES